MKLDRAITFALLDSLLREDRTVRLPARGRSMAPAIPDGALLVLQRVEPHQVRRGDVVVLRSPGGELCGHRVRAVLRLGRRGVVLTQGDANPRPDRPRPLSAVVARVVEVQPPQGSAVLVAPRRRRSICSA